MLSLNHFLRPITTRPFSTGRCLVRPQKHLTGAQLWKRHVGTSPEPSQPSRPSSEPSRPQRNVIGAFTPTSAAIFVVVGVGLFWYFRNEKAKLQEQREKERMSKSYGRPHVGGPFSLVNCTAAPSSSEERFTHEDLLRKWSLVYFGFTNCPDICPAELDKVTAVVNELRQSNPDLPLQPVFISVDPARDTPSTIRTYLTDFHPSFVGLVGNFEQTKSVCKAYRVYFSTPPDADPKGDYLVDHSIFVYLMDPEGRFVEAFGQTAEKEEMVDKIRQFVVEWSR
ncbi:h-sco1 [Lentinula edodes]|uniref:SCO1/SenC-domain-containing protein n=1 Tax=Lentinula edodes TaxID=5353 RepID=UPI001E8CA8EF|nr:SCO1/SenC-domain-containing protein [Lentinula edodes]XP_046086211.1 SCO1/SenC-domain-containing protein [Lentinula edodes]XP_046090583.1 SCO1/SenC-domain-containing protein [Lentinula edodes]KAH7867654.1 SCO1/SenC-domain-containing protein [Lentinula edodes]KAH7875117.1 SCO1/SenC-domain-containing protein [Lentinula edodes]KAH7879489.1 SCO1/SenC-domain-containing protein [Lentinula edodes]KAJ3907707.1 h-sco1 [Lentinula edodes]